MHLFTIILSLVAFGAHSSLPLSRDFVSKKGNDLFRLGYNGKSNPMPTIHSTFCIQKLARTERAIYIEIRKLLDQNTSSVTNSSGQLVQYAKDYEESALVPAAEKNLKTEGYIRAVASNLNSIYRMIRRFRNFVQVWILSSKRSTGAVDDNVIKILKNIYNVDIGPFRIDLHLSMFAFPVLQFQLDMKADQIAAGVFNGRQTGVKLKAIHSLEIGIHSVASGFYPIGIEWIEHALEKVNQGDTTVNTSLVQGYLHKAISKHDANWRPFNEKDMVQVFYTKPLNQTVDVSQRRWRKELNYTLPDYVRYFPNEDYGGLCNGHIQQSGMQTSKLFCWYESSIHPFWKLAPLKSELLSPLPDQVVQFHQVIPDAFTNELRQETETNFTSSMQNKFNNIHPRIEYAMKIGSIPDFLEDQIGNLLNRLSGLQVKNYSTNNNEPIRLYSYAPGSFPPHHVDFLSEEIQHERMATLIIYLDGAEIGGSTDFPRLNLTAPAIKGSAILWFSLNSAGEHAENTIHGSCPVVIGAKLSAVKWIPYVQQSHLKCDLNKEAGLDYLSNARS